MNDKTINIIYLSSFMVFLIVGFIDLSLSHIMVEIILGIMICVLAFIGALVSIDGLYEGEN